MHYVPSFQLRPESGHRAPRQIRFAPIASERAAAKGGVRPPRRRDEFSTDSHARYATLRRVLRGMRQWPFMIADSAAASNRSRTSSLVKEILPFRSSALITGQSSGPIGPASVSPFL